MDRRTLPGRHPYRRLPRSRRPSSRPGPAIGWPRSAARPARGAAPWQWRDGRNARRGASSGPPSWMRGPRPVARAWFFTMVADDRHSTSALIAVKRLPAAPGADCHTKTASLRGKTIDREVKAVIHFASSLKATAPEIAPGAFLCWRDTRQWVMEAGYFQTRPDTHQ